MPTPKGLLAKLRQEVDVPDAILVTEDLEIPVPTRDQMVDYSSAETPDDRLRAIYGDHYDEIIDLFNGEPIHIWKAFHEHVLEQFFGKGADEVEGK